MANELDNLLRGLDRFAAVALDGARDGLGGAAAGLTFEMRSTSAHGDATGATRANYTAYVVGRGADGSAERARAIQAVEFFNPGHVAQSSVHVPGLGVVVTSFTDYQVELETENAGEKAVLGPTIEASGDRLTAAAAAGSKRALS